MYFSTKRAENEKKKKKKKENVEFANIVATDEATQNEPPHLNLHCLPSCL